MAVYPEGNPGAFPMIPGSTVTTFRILYGDTVSDPYSPPAVGFQNYRELSDEEIEGFLAAGADSVPRGIGYYYLALAGKAALESKSVADYDLKVDLTKRAADLREAAKMWFDRADDEDATAGGDEWFDLVPTGSREGSFIPEAAPPIYGRRYTWDRIF